MFVFFVVGFFVSPASPLSQFAVFEISVQKVVGGTQFSCLQFLGLPPEVWQPQSLLRLLIAALSVNADLLILCLSAHLSLNLHSTVQRDGANLTILNYCFFLSCFSVYSV